MYLPYLLQAIPGSFRTSTCLAALSLHAAFYVISVRQTRGLPSPSFRFHLSMDTLGVQLYPSHYRAGSGLSPFRFCPCREHNDHLWEGKYSPRDAHGKRISRNVYAKTREECEEKLAAMIEEMKKEIAEEKEKMKSKAGNEFLHGNSPF